jgi:hypothetical protein
MSKAPCFAWHSCVRFCSGVSIALTWLALSTAQAQTTTYTLGTTALLVGPGAGTNSVVLAVTPATGTWTATTNAPWLHLSMNNQSGAGSTNVVFCYDANPGATRTGTLTIGGQTLTVAQAGSTYVAAGAVTTLPSIGVEPRGTTGPFGITVDCAGNVYTAFSPGPQNKNNPSSAIEEWTPTNNTAAEFVFSSLIHGVAADWAHLDTVLNMEGL